jgi:hypothetical protein
VEWPTGGVAKTGDNQNSFASFLLRKEVLSHFLEREVAFSTSLTISAFCGIPNFHCNERGFRK